MPLLNRLTNRGRDLLFVPPLDRHWRRRRRGRTDCLLYHRVDLPGQVPFLDAYGVPPIPPEQLEGELAFLQRQGALFLTFADLRRGMQPPADRVAVLVSFDDGLLDNYTNGLEVLGRLGIRATIFQSSALVDADQLIWEHALYWIWHQRELQPRLAALAQRQLPALAPLQGRTLLEALREQVPIPAVENLLAEFRQSVGGTEAMAEQARRLYPRRADLLRAREAGHEIGSHGHHHYPRRSLEDGAFEQELVRSASLLGELLGERPQAFSYPFNSYA
ncbi:MAG: polysaccharide deacetylase family protein, partial [Cyanobacteriota bacterium]